MDSREVLIPRVLKQAGYVSGIFGKWDLGQLHRFLPLQRGRNSWPKLSLAAPSATFGFLSWTGKRDTHDCQETWPLTCDWRRFLLLSATKLNENYSMNRRGG